MGLDGKVIFISWTISHHNTITLLSPVDGHWPKSCWKEMCLLDGGFQVGHFDYSINLFVYISIYLFTLGARESSFFFSLPLSFFLSYSNFMINWFLARRTVHGQLMVARYWMILRCYRPFAVVTTLRISQF